MWINPEITRVELWTIFCTWISCWRNTGVDFWSNWDWQHVKSSTRLELRRGATALFCWYLDAMSRFLLVQTFWISSTLFLMDLTHMHNDTKPLHMRLEEIRSWMGQGDAVKSFFLLWQQNRGIVRSLSNFCSHSQRLHLCQFRESDTVMRKRLWDSFQSVLRLWF